jgi:hypothetical protein
MSDRSYGPSRSSDRTIYAWPGRAVSDHESLDRGLSRVRGGDPLHEYCGPLFGSQRGHKHGQEGVRRNAQLGTHRLPIAHNGIVHDAVCYHPNRIRTVPLAHEVICLTCRHGDDGGRTGPHRPEKQSLVCPIWPQSPGIGPQMLGHDMRGAVAYCEKVTKHVCADAPCDDGRRPMPGELHDPTEPDRVGAVAQFGTLHWESKSPQLVEIRPAPIERQDAHVKSAFAEARYQKGPLSLRAAGLKIPAHE